MGMEAWQLAAPLQGVPERVGVRALTCLFYRGTLAKMPGGR